MNRFAFFQNMENRRFRNQMFQNAPSFRELPRWWEHWPGRSNIGENRCVYDLKDLVSRTLKIGMTTAL